VTEFAAARNPLMHELSIATALVEVACEEAEHRGLARVEALHVRIGPLAGIVKEALLFSFDLAAAGTAIEGARLEVEESQGSELELVALEVAE
jgi:hydrogenase nickel incorporation protein HypA/HybF